jgi:hypothetical protein
VSTHADALKAVAFIPRDGDTIERLLLLPMAGDHHSFQSAHAPKEPHEFEAELQLSAAGREERLSCMEEPEGRY